MSVRLTRSNYNGPTLHSDFVKKDAQPAKVQQNAPTAIVKHSEDVGIFAPPESSDEDEDRAPQSESDEPSIKRKREEDDAPQAKRAKPSSQPTRKSGRSQPSQPTLSVQPSQPPSTGFMDLFASFDDPTSSQSSQRRKQKSTYSKHSQSNIRSSPPNKSQISIPKDPSLDSSRGSKKAFVNPAASPSRALVFSPRKKLKQPPVETPESSQPPTVQFSLPDDPSLDDSGGYPHSPNRGAGVFDIDDLPEPKRSRRGSTSSLSSVDSIASAYLSQSQKNDLRNGIESSQDLPPGCVQCPICKARVARTVSSTSTKSSRSKPSLPSSPSKLSLRAQQAFCHNHQTATADAQWIERKYPTIDWDDLENRRISTHTDHLRKVLFRKTPSSYLTQLDAAVKDAKGNRRKLTVYLNHQSTNSPLIAPSSFSTTASTSTSNPKPTTAISTIHPPTQAYYGPHGAKIMSQTIASLLSKPIRHQLKSDATVSAAGVAGYISAVLAPELCLRLVMEDIRAGRPGGKDGDSEGGDEAELEERARTVMQESSEIGALLNPDEDVLERDGEDE